MGIYVVTGATKGIGYEAARYLRDRGQEVINIDVDKGDICADLGTPKGRELAISEIYDRYDAIDGLILNAGVAYSSPLSKVVSINYYGSVALAEGLYPLLKKHSGRCVVTVSGGIAYLDHKRPKYFFDSLLANCSDEERVCQLIDRLPAEGTSTIYLSTKIGLVRYVRRHAPAWAVEGVSLNALAPGSVDTTIMNAVPHYLEARKAGEDLYSIKTPTVYGRQDSMPPESVGPALGMLVLPESRGISGAVVYCDGGASAVLHTDKWY